MPRHADFREKSGVLHPITSVGRDRPGSYKIIDRPRPSLNITGLVYFSLNPCLHVWLQAAVARGYAAPVDPRTYITQSRTLRIYDTLYFAGAASESKRNEIRPAISACCYPVWILPIYVWNMYKVVYFSYIYHRKKKRFEKNYFFNCDYDFRKPDLGAKSISCDYKAGLPRDNTYLWRNEHAFLRTVAVSWDNDMDLGPWSIV